VCLGLALSAGIILVAMDTSAKASEPVLLHAAGSLRSALTEVASAFEAASGQKVEARYGPSGTLKDEIAGGMRAEVFASANMEHPQALAAAGKSGPVVLFARNRLCALVRPGLAVEPATLLDRMLDPNVKLGASTPRADPSGDYAWEMFRKADKVKPGAFDAAEKKALQLTGGPTRRRPRRDARSMVSWSPKAKPTSFSPIAPVHSRRRSRTPASRSLPSPMSSRWAPTTG
jgi:molybdate transport system substrate-binding protein